MQTRPTLVRLVQLNFGLSLYLDRIFRLKLSLRLSLSGNFEASAQRKSKRNHFTFWLKSGLRPNFSSSKGSAIR